MLLPYLLYLSSQGIRKMIESLGLTMKIKRITGKRKPNIFFPNSTYRYMRKSRISGSDTFHFLSIHQPSLTGV